MYNIFYSLLQYESHFDYNKRVGLVINNNDKYDLMKFLRFEGVYIFHYLFGYVVTEQRSVCL